MSMWKQIGGYDDVRDHGIVAELRVGLGYWRRLTAYTAKKGNKVKLILHYRARTFPFGRVNNYFELDARGIDVLEGALRAMRNRSS